MHKFNRDFAGFKPLTLEIFDLNYFLRINRIIRAINLKEKLEMTVPIL